MIQRLARREVERALERQAAVALNGPRQAGKTTLALEIAATRPSVYLDLESAGDRRKLADARTFLDQHVAQLVILDEIQRMPELFLELRGAIDRGRRQGMRHGRFLVLGSASLDVMLRADETLAGRIAYLDLGPFNALEVGDRAGGVPRLWLRGGFPESYLARTDAESVRVRQDLTRSYLHRELALFNPRLPAVTLERLWTMLAHGQGGLLNQAQLAGSLGVSGSTVARYVDVLVDLLVVRRLPPVHTNAGKRLVKSPKVYVRDSGIVHALLGLGNNATLLGHPVVGASWEGFVIENLLAVAPQGTLAGFYRTGGGAEIDLVLDLPGGARWAVEAKFGTAPTLGRGFHHARADLRPDRTLVVYGGAADYPLPGGVEVVSLRSLATDLAELSPG